MSMTLQDYSYIDNKIASCGNDLALGVHDGQQFPDLISSSYLTRENGRTLCKLLTHSDSKWPRDL